MRLLIQIPAFNEEETLGATLSALPRNLSGFDSVEWLVIDDGSTDRTAEVARAYGANYLLRFSEHRGLAAAFSAGLEACLELDADIIVNTDADNQYCADDISRLLSPVLLNGADMVVGARSMQEIEDFSWMKKFLQRFGSWVVRKLSGTQIPDCTSGFRALRREAAAQLRVLGEYTYTLETIIQAGRKGMKVTSVPIRTNRVTRPSRLIKSVPSYVFRCLATILRHFCMYQPLTAFLIPGACLGGLGLAFAGHYLCLRWLGRGGQDLPDLILAVFLLGLSFLSVTAGFLADLFSVTRKLLENVDSQTQSQRFLRPAGRKTEVLGSPRPTPAFLLYLARRETTLESISK